LGFFYNSLNFLIISDFLNILCHDMKVYNVYSSITLTWNHEFLTYVISLHAGIPYVQHNFKKLKNITSEYAKYLNGHKKNSY
jgi:hypothetical protein